MILWLLFNFIMNKIHKLHVLFRNMYVYIILYLFFSRLSVIGTNTYSSIDLWHIRINYENFDIFVCLEIFLTFSRLQKTIHLSTYFKLLKAQLYRSSKQTSRISCHFLRWRRATAFRLSPSVYACNYDVLTFLTAFNFIRNVL